jgi:hypothetical protein
VIDRRRTFAIARALPRGASARRCFFREFHPAQEPYRRAKRSSRREELPMSSTIFALLLFGCSDDGSACRQLAAQPKYYDSQVLCEADIDFALQSDVSLRSDYPSVVAKCLPVKELTSLERGPIDLRDGRFTPLHRFNR